MSTTLECLVVPGPSASAARPWDGLRRRSRVGALPSPRMQAVVAAGALAALVAMVVGAGVLPLARHWRAREGRLDARTEQLARVRGLAAAEGALAEAVRVREARLAAGPHRPLAGRTAAGAGAALGVLVQQVAGEARVQVERVELAQARAVGADAALVTATVSAVGDVYGLTDLLERLHRGATLVEVSALDVRALPTRGREAPLHLTLTVRAAWGPR